MSLNIGDSNPEECRELLKSLDVGLGPDHHREAVEDAVKLCCSQPAVAHTCKDALVLIGKWCYIGYNG